MSSDTNVAQHLSFWQLLQDHDIEIPIIQRDYAQGRADKVKVRDKFLDALTAALDGSPVELDFVYGSSERDHLQPLDGQQRLTTLFLLHWYAAWKEGCLNNEVGNVLKRFSYRTRISSRDFCQSLVEKSIPRVHTDGLISKSIEDASWFYLSWKHDPTIKAMLIMLDAIHKKFGEKNDLWQKLTNDQSRPVTFYYLELADFGLSDDLYIKMNARGKQLSTFENFKAGFIKCIEVNSWDHGKGPEQSFSHKADTEWTDLFWDNGHRDESFDKAFINFIACSAAEAIALSDARSEQKEKRIQSLVNDPENVSPEDFSQAAYNRLYESLTVYCRNKNTELTLDFPFWHLLDVKETLLSVITSIKTRATYQRRVLAFAQTEYLLQDAPYSPETFKAWMRVVRNIALNQNIDSPATFIGAINLIKELSAGSHDIYGFLAVTPIKSDFASSQLREECLKARVILTDKRYDLISQAEDSNFSKGKIEFALHCSGYTKENPSIDYDLLEKVCKVFQRYLNGDDVTNEFRRALLTIGDHNFYHYWQSWSYGANAQKRCLIKDMNDLKRYSNNHGFRHYLKSLLLKLTEQDLGTVIDQFMAKAEGYPAIPAWKMRLIKEGNLLDNYCRSKYIAIPHHQEHCFLLNVGRTRDKSAFKKVG